MARKRVSIKDIAEAAGVSHPTVSRALRGQGRMSESTRTNIIAIAQEMGYTPSLVARGLVTQRSFCVGLIVPDFSDPFHSAVAQGIEEIAEANGYSLFLASNDVDAEQEMRVARSFHGRQVDGIIVTSSLVGNGYVDLIDETGVPMVIINTMTPSESIHTVHHDDYSGGCQLVNHLLAQGCRHIAYLGNAQSGQAHQERQRAWSETLQAAGLRPELVTHSATNQIDGGIEGCNRLLDRALELWRTPPDAIYCYSDLMAIGALYTIRHRGLRVPQDVLVTGFDDLDFAAVLDPPLTTHKQPRRVMGAKAMNLLLILMNRSHGNVSQKEVEKATVMAGELVIRQSTQNDTI